MALNAAQQNIATAMQQMALNLLELKNQMPALLRMYATEGLTTVTDADYAELSEFVHITVSDMNAAKNALAAIDTALGNYEAGEASLFLSRILAKVPS